MNDILESFSLLGQGITSATALQLVLAFLAGGYITSWMTERWQRRRDTRAGRLQRLEQLVRVYQRYTRLLRQLPSKRREGDLDFLHADYLAEIRILEFDRQFKAEAEELRKLAQRMANVRSGQSAEGQEKSDLNKVSRDFSLLLDKLADKI